MAILREITIGSLDNDLVFENGDLKVIDGVDALAQRVRVELNVFKGEWIFDESIGVPWSQYILGKKPNLSLISSILRNKVSQVQGVDYVKDFSVGFDRPTRTLSVTGRVIADTSDPVDLDIPLEINF